ncbi:MAG: RNA 3'-terminal phosphate cyclase [Planctomycetes bacterium]|nr:RNA 3'-terminal phosphate cyclase [Planctomycetota bacterium]
MLTIDGSQGEGGGQILRTSLSLALVTGTPFRIERIRAGRERPGLLRQHLTAVQAAARVGSAEVRGAELGSKELEFRPGAVNAGHYRFAVGTAGSAGLVFQTVLPALLRAGGPSTLELEGGTHNPLAPPFDFLARMGARVELALERHGFFPAGGGRFTARIEPARTLTPLVLEERGALVARRARALVANLPAKIGDVELDAARRALGWRESECSVELVRDCAGPGNVLLLEVEHQHGTELVASFGERDVRSATVAERGARELARYLESGVPVGEHLADQLVLPLVLARSGSFVTLAPTEHLRTNLDVVRRFVDVPLALEELGADRWRVRAG